MAPRTAKVKKTADVKVASSEAPKKGRGKTKDVEEEEAINTPEPDEEIVDVKKNKRGKKIINYNEEKLNGKSEEAEPVAKLGRKKKGEKVPLTEKASKKMKKEDIPELDEERNGDNADTNSDIEKNDVVLSGKGRKKGIKKEDVQKLKKVEEKPKVTSKGRKNLKQNNDHTDATEDLEKEVLQEKSKPSKGRGRKAQSKAEEEEPEESTNHESDDQNSDDNVKEYKILEQPAGKGKNKAQTKIGKENTSDTEEMESEEYKQEEDPLMDEPPQKKPKGKKTQGKKAVKEQITKTEKDEVHKEELPIKKIKTAKKDEKDKGDNSDEGIDEEVKMKPAKGRRGAKKVIEANSDNEEEDNASGEQTNKRQRKAAEDKAGDEAKKKAPPKNKVTTNYEDIDFSNMSVNEQGKAWNLKISSWNVDGIRAWMSKGGLDYIKYEKPDILCLQEVKCSQEKIPEEALNVPGYHAYWLCSDKDGYAGVGIYTNKMAINVEYGLQNEELDSEGRIITAEYEQFYLICTYVPNAGRKLVTLPKRLKWNEEFRKYVKELDKKKPVVICGDMNVAHTEIDLTNPKTNKKNAGFTEEERSGMTEFLGDGYIDTYRHLYPDKTGAYTFWTYMMNSRSKNVGWRLDYFIMSERLLPSLCDNVIRSEVYGSDHCPISLFLHLTSADKPKE